MVTESGLKLRTKLESAKTQETIGVVVEDVATSSDFVLVYEAEKIVVPKATGVTLAVGDAVYYDPANNDVTPTTTSNTKAGRALEAVGTTDDEVLIDLMVMV